MTSLALLLAAALAAPAQRTAEPDPPDVEALRALALVASGEPTAAEVERAAAQRADAALARAAPVRIAALLPRIAVEYRHDERSDRVLGLQGSGEVDYVRFGPGNSFSVRAIWDLSLLAAPAADRDAPRPDARRKDEIVRRAIDAYFERRRLRLVLLLDPPREPRARAEAELQVDRLTAELDALTGGLFARRRP